MAAVVVAAAAVIVCCLSLFIEITFERTRIYDFIVESNSKIRITPLFQSQA